MRPLLAAAATLLAMAVGNGAPRPAAFIVPSGALMITLPGSLLSSSEVNEQLTSGLTTVFMISGSARDGRNVVKGGLRLEVRYELWEEKYLVTAIDGTGTERTSTLDSKEAFERWWGSEAQLLLPPRAYDALPQVEMTLTMLPFSAQEEADARRWLSRTLSAGGGSGANGSGERAAEALRMIAETSIRRHPLLVRKWSVGAQRRPR